MRTTLIATWLAVVASQVGAQNSYNITSKPFALVLLSSNSTINGSSLLTCHQGAAIDGLCVGPKFEPQTADSFNFNTSYTDGANQSNKQGKVASILQGGNFVVPQTLSLVASWSSNVAVPIFYPGDEGGNLFKFDSRNRLAVSSWVDDSVSPIETGREQDYYRWYACNTYYGYKYFTLAWVLGNKPPQNPSCQKVEVVRIFLSKKAA